MFGVVLFFVVFTALCVFRAWRWWSNERRISGERARGEWSCAGILLAPEHIARGTETHPLAGVSATVETVGQLQRRITATRLATLGVFALAMRKKQDDRQLYLTVSGPDFNWLVELDPDLGSTARQFAAAVTHAGRVAA